MSNQKRCQKAAKAPACPEKARRAHDELSEAPALILPARHLDTLRAASTAYRRLFELRATSPEWRKAYAEWQRLAEDLAGAAVREFDAQRELQP
ncbi:hypothetical protein E5198_11955 [Pseudomonas sp. A-1]|uniref:hypothetical protein n=1 Tax=Pseudomonas sp. A-1 TaxID=1821274 RepID=UPI0010A5E0FC|nr:hypothetical protein [Pseudomonas sp. A-1]THG81553.1 hypothetical protein E5198_11955 [Pseudomonas sp. A-1]